MIVALPYAMQKSRGAARPSVPPVDTPMITDRDVGVAYKRYLHDTSVLTRTHTQ